MRLKIIRWKKRKYEKLDKNRGNVWIKGAKRGKGVGMGGKGDWKSGKKQTIKMEKDKEGRGKEEK